MPFYRDIPFYRKQMRIALRNCGLIDPENIEEYIAPRRLRALRKALTEMTARAGDRRGEGFRPARPRRRGLSDRPQVGVRRKARRKPKYVVCNADEGDPGAFMDRSILEGDPHSVIEGMAIAAYAIGAHEGYIYCRAEYPLAITRLKIAIAQAHEYGLLGDNILGTDFSFNLHVKEGAGAFVCGEETALMASIEGRRGEPRPRPPFPAVSGLWGKPRTSTTSRATPTRPQIILHGRGVVRRHRHREEPGHGGLRADRQGQQHRPDRSADGHHPGRDHLRHRRRRAQGQEVQGRADRRPAGRLHARFGAEHAGGLRLAHGGRRRRWAPAA